MSARSEILDWAEQGRIPPDRLCEAMRAGGVLPDAQRWRNFIDRSLLFAGSVLLAVGVIFFIAFNWQELGRFAKFALVEAALLLALGIHWKLDGDSLASKAALLAAALLAGGLFALIGQTYQTGADTFELFATWALAILPWALLARFPVLWIVWLVLLNLAVALYFQTLGHFWFFAFGQEKLLWLLFALNTTALVIWESLAALGIGWLRQRWATRLLAFASGGLVTALAVWHVGESRYGKTGFLGGPAWLIWLAAAYACYGHRMRDVFVLACGLLSVIIVTTLFFAIHLLKGVEAFYVLAVWVVCLSAFGGMWLRRLHAESQMAEDAHDTAGDRGDQGPPSHQPDPPRQRIAP